MKTESKKELLKIARKSVEAAVNYQPAYISDSANPELKGKQGTFVTLKNKGRLRGCLGNFTSNIPLHEQISNNAASSATQDSRFALDRITPAELDELDIEISVLSPMQRIDNPLDLELGVHGIYIKDGFNAGCFLPQVAVETGWTKEEFLSKCCQSKAGMSPNAWKDKNVEVSVFTAEIFGEKSLG